MELRYGSSINLIIECTCSSALCVYHTTGHPDIILQAE